MNSCGGFLAAEPCLNETSEGGIQERGDAADTGRALGVRGDGRLHQPGSWHLPELPLPNLDVGVLRFSMILSSPFEGLLLVNDLDAA